MTVRLAAERVSLLGNYSRNTAEHPAGGHASSNQPPWAEHHPGEEGDFNFASLLRIFWTNKWGILFSAVFFAGLAAWSVFLETPLYTSTASVVLETDEQQNVVEYQSVIPQLSSNRYAMNTEILVLRSQDLMGRIVEAMALEKDPEFNPLLRPAPGWDKNFGYEQLMKAFGFGKAPPPPSNPTPKQTRETAIGKQYRHNPDHRLNRRPEPCRR